MIQRVTAVARIAAGRPLYAIALLGWIWLEWHLVSGFLTIMTYGEAASANAVLAGRSVGWLAYVGVAAVPSVAFALVLVVPALREPIGALADELSASAGHAARRAGSARVSDVLRRGAIVVFVTAAFVSVPEVALRALFVARYSEAHAPASLLVPFSSRYDDSVVAYVVGYGTHLADPDAESAARQAYVQLQRSRLLFSPYVGFTSDPPFQPYPVPPRPAGQLRVIVLGGSAAMASLSEVIPAIVSEGGRRGISFQMIDAGRQGYVSGQEIAMLGAELLDLHPDVLVFFDGFNDISVVEAGEVPGRPLFSRDLATAFSESSPGPVEQQLADIAKRSFAVQATLNLLRHGSLFEPTVEAKAEGPAFDEARRVYLRNLQIAAKIARGYAMKMVVALQPVDTSDEARGRFYSEQFERITAAACELARAEGFVFDDLSHVVPHGAFRDIVHFGGADPVVRGTLASSLARDIAESLRGETACHAGSAG